MLSGDGFRFRNLAKLLMLGSAISGAVGCAALPTTDADSGPDCRHTAIEDLFRNPQDFHDQVVCTAGFYFDRGQPILHAESAPNDNSFYKYVVILDFDEAMIVRDAITIGDFVSVRGVLTVPSICWDDPAVDGEDLVAECIPFSKPVDLTLAEISLATHSE